MTTYNIKYLDIYETLGNLLSSNITDIKAGRTGKWIFPDFPDTDSNLPQITIKLSSPTYVNDSAGDFIYEEYDSTNNVYKEFFYKRAVATVNIYALTGKRQELATTLDGVDRIFKNKILNLYLTNLIKDVLFKKRPDLLSEFLDFHLRDVSPTFENGENMWASDLRCEIEYKDVWTNEYQDGVLIASYSITKTIQE